MEAGFLLRGLLLQLLLNAVKQTESHQLFGSKCQKRKQQQSCVPLQVSVHAVVPIKARQPHQVPRSTAALLLATQTAVAHAAAHGTRPVLQSQCTQHDNPCRSSLLSAENTPLVFV